MVQKIDQLTSDIDIGKEEPGDTFRWCPSETMDIKVASSQEVHYDEPSIKTPTPSRAPPAYPIRDQGLHEVDPKLDSTQETLTSQTSGINSKRRSQKPPPYPYASTMGRVNLKAKDKSQKTPPYPFRRRLLSTIV